MNCAQPGSPGRGCGRGAFTLIELLVVIAIIALLVSMLLPSLQSAKEQANEALCLSNLHTIAGGVAMYLSEHDDTYPCAQDPVSTDPYYWLWMGRGWRGPVEEYVGGATGPGGPSALFCSSDPAEDRYDATSYAYSMSFYHSPEQIDTLSSTADTYSDPLPPRPQRSWDVARPSAKILIGEWTSNHHRVQDDKGWWCWKGERTYLFADGSAEPVPAEKIEPARDELPDANLTVHGIDGWDVSR